MLSAKAVSPAKNKLSGRAARPAQAVKSTPLGRSVHFRKTAAPINHPGKAKYSAKASYSVRPAHSARPNYAVRPIHVAKSAPYVKVNHPAKLTPVNVPSRRVPPGFENLSMGREAVLEVRYLGRVLGTFLTQVEADTISFKEPGLVLDAIALNPRWAQDDTVRDTLLRKLSAPMPRNSDKVCARANMARISCDFIHTEDADVIFDEKKESLALFVKKEWAAAPQARDGLYEPSPDTRRALVQSQLLNANAMDRNYHFAAAFSSALGVSSSSFLGANYNFASNAYAGRQRSRMLVDNLYYRHDHQRRHYLQGGLMDQRNLSSPIGGSFGFTMLPTGRIAGVRVGTTSAYRGRDATNQRTPMTVLLTRPARVAAFRGEQLLGSFYLDAGAQDVDTSSFPPGSYLVDLQIIEDGRLARTEQLPFSRVDQGAGNPGDIQWFMQAGRDKSRSFRMEQGASLLGGMKYALTNSTSLTGGLAAQRKRVYAEGRLDWQNVSRLGRVRATAALFAGNDGSRGDSQQLFWSKGLSASLFRTNRRSPDCSASHYMGCYRSLSGTVAGNAGGWALSSTYRRNWSASSFQQPWRQGRAPHAVGLLPGEWPGTQNTSDFAAGGARWVARETRSDSVDVSASNIFRMRGLMASPHVTVYQRRANQNNERGVFASLTLWRAEPTTAPDAFARYASVGTSLQHRKKDTAVRYQANHTWSRRVGTVRQVAVNVAGAGKETVDLRARSLLQGAWGRADLGVGNTFHAGGRRRTTRGANVSRASRPSFIGTYASAFALARDGLYWGPDYGINQPIAGIGVRVDKAAEGQDAGQAVAQVGDQTIGFGSRAFVPVDGFTKRSIEIRDVGGTRTGGVAAVRTGAGQREWFMLPGQLSVQRVSVDITYTYAGRFRAVDKHGAPTGLDLDGAVVLDAAVPNVGERGSFLIDMSRRPKALHLVHRDQVYRCLLPQRQSKHAISHLGVVNCTRIEAEALPKPLLTNRRAAKVLQSRRAVNPPAHTVISRNARKHAEKKMR